MSNCAIDQAAKACAASPVATASRGKRFENGTTTRNAIQLPVPRAASSMPIVLSG